MNRFVPNCRTLRDRMLAEIGVKRVEDLFTPVPEKVRMRGLLNLPPAMSEMELVREYARLAKSNTSHELVCFRGAGSYDHFIPAAVDSILTRSEFFTAYTPYQAEVSQGTLQAIFEYQTMIARLCGTEAANAGMYDGASATAEAALMAMRVTGVNRVLVAGSLNPSYREVIETYLVPGGFQINEIPFGPDGLLDPGAVRTLIQGGAAAMVLQSPNYFGLVENIALASETARAGNALLVVVADPISLGVIQAPGALGADIVVGDGQPLGIPMGFGGPYAGFLATSTAHLRKMPGRIIGRTEDRAGNTGYVMTLQTREQHIRREKATSNICTNQALMALANAVYLSLTGEAGFREIARQCHHKAHYLEAGLVKAGARRIFSAPFVREFALRLPGDAFEFEDRLLSAGFLPGLPVPGLGSDAMLFAVTEKRTREEMDAFIGAFSKACGEVR